MKGTFSLKIKGENREMVVSIVGFVLKKRPWLILSCLNKDSIGARFSINGLVLRN